MRTQGSQGVVKSEKSKRKVKIKRRRKSYLIRENEWHSITEVTEQWELRFTLPIDRLFYLELAAKIEEFEKLRSVDLVD